MRGRTATSTHFPVRLEDHDEALGTTMKRYHCPVELAVDVIGGKWRPVILAHLKEGVHRYGELRRRMPDVSEKMLTQRLRELEADGLVTRRALATSPPHVEYALTEEGRSLAPVLQALYDWGTARAERTGTPVDAA
jgi:DNA-binding HxlR family transcriptional regulator